MSDRRSFQWRSGSLPSTPIIDFWQIARTHQDPPIPNLSLEDATTSIDRALVSGFQTRTHRSRRALSIGWSSALTAQGSAPVVVPASAWLGGTVADARRATRRRLLTADPVTVSNAAATPSADRALAQAFTTRTVNGRRSRSIGWTAALTAQGSPAVVPAAAWFSRPQVHPRRRSIEREIVVVEPLQWQYIAPTVAAVIERPKAKVIEFRRTLRLTPQHNVYPPQTGPPGVYPAWAATRVRSVSQRRRLQELLEQPAYPATPSPVTYAALVEHRLPRTAFKRRLQVAADQPSYPATSVTASSDRALANAFETRTTRSRRLLKAPSLVVANAAAPPLPVVFAATVAPKTKRRKSRPGLFLGGGGGSVLSAAASTTPAVYPSFVTRPVKRVEFERTRQTVAPILHVAPATPGASQAPESAWRAIKARRSEQHRKLLPQAAQIVYPATPAPPAVVYAALVAAKAKRRKGRAALFLGGGASVDGYQPAPVAQPISAWAAPKANQVSFDRRALRVEQLDTFAQIPPAPPQPEQAWRAKAAIRTERNRKLLPQSPQIDYPETPAVIGSAGRVYIRGRRSTYQVAGRESIHEMDGRRQIVTVKKDSE